MAIEGVPWMVAGGLHSAEVGRSLAFAATGGRTGVILPGDLKVTALPTPGAGVRIAAGSASIVSNFPASSGQSYIARGVGSTDLAVAKAGTSTTTRYVIIRITDPAYAGQPVPTNPVVGPYAIPEVVSNIVGLAFPFIALAQITMPANATTVTDAMITNLRSLTAPKTSREVISNAGGVATLTSTSGVAFPPYTPSIPVPEWATWVHIIIHLAGLKQNGSLAEANLQVFMEDAPMGGALALDFDNVVDGVRHTTMVTGSGLVPTALLGKTARIGIRGFRTNAGSRPGTFSTDNSTHVAFDVQFSQRTV